MKIIDIAKILLGAVSGLLLSLAIKVDESGNITTNTYFIYALFGILTIITVSVILLQLIKQNKQLKIIVTESRDEIESLHSYIDKIDNVENNENKHIGTKIENWFSSHITAAYEKNNKVPTVSNHKYRFIVDENGKIIKGREKEKLKGKKEEFETIFHIKESKFELIISQNSIHKSVYNLLFLYRPKTEPLDGNLKKGIMAYVDYYEKIVLSPVVLERDRVPSENTTNSSYESITDNIGNNFVYLKEIVDPENYND